jgi:hypothetical protein
MQLTADLQLMPRWRMSGPILLPPQHTQGQLCHKQGLHKKIDAEEFCSKVCNYDRKWKGAIRVNT